MIRKKFGRLRVVSMIEGLSLMLLVFVAVPIKYVLTAPMLVKIFGPIHGGLFLLFIFMTIAAGVEHQWKFRRIAGLILSSIIPFGCLYAEKKIFEPMEKESAV